MNRRIVFGRLLAACVCLLLVLPVAAEPVAPLPTVLEQGFQSWSKKLNATYAIDIWKKGGLLEDDRKPTSLANYFSRIDRTIGNFKSYEVVSSKDIGQGSQIFYCALHFERSAVYGRFLVYHTDKGWVVQNMDFSTKPEAIMPWLAFSEVNYSEQN